MGRDRRVTVGGKVEFGGRGGGNDRMDRNLGRSDFCREGREYRVEDR